MRPIKTWARSRRYGEQSDHVRHASFLFGRVAVGVLYSQYKREWRVEVRRRKAAKAWSPVALGYDTSLRDAMRQVRRYLAKRAADNFAGV